MFGCCGCRQGVVLDDIKDDDDEDVKKSGCLPHRSRSATFGSPNRQRRASEQSHQSKIAEKLLRFFRPTGSQSGSGRQSPPSRGGGGASQAPRRRFMRVVKDENAPPPECIGDNPNIICRYSQEYLSKHYAEVERSREVDCSRPTLPYTTSGLTILKKSSTDPTSDRRAASTTIKHTTFCDVVTVVESDAGELHEERLHEVEDSIDDAEERPPSQTGFFLSHTDSDSVPIDDIDGSVPDSSSVVQKDDVFEEELRQKDVSSGLMSVFSTAATPKSDSSQQSPEEPQKTPASLRTTKHVKLVDLMAQIRGEDGGERA